MVVELDIFSGRPNPRWHLTEDEAAQVASLIESLELAEGDPSPNPPGLGYRGFRLSDSAGPPYWAYGGFVLSSEALLADPSRRVEHFLLDHLPAEFNELRQSLEVELGPS